MSVVCQSHYERFWMLANASFQAYAVKSEGDSHAGFAQALGVAMRDAVMFDVDTCIRHCRQNITAIETQPITFYGRGLIAGYQRAIYTLSGGSV